MGGVLMALQVLVGLASLVCFILVLIKMFQNGQTTLGVVCIVLVLCVGIGARSPSSSAGSMRTDGESRMS
jgi:hypothetical protein